MLSKMRNTNQKGFTLIELMIVIAIIGILAAIAIPNFIAYRNKSFCSAAEADANAIASRISDYYSIPTRTLLVDLDDIGGIDIMSGGNTAVIDSADATPNSTISIEVTDASSRCPDEYQGAMDADRNPMGYWDAGTYIKTLN